MKKILLVMLLAMSATSHAQLSAFINGKAIKEGASVSKNDLASLQVGFKNPKKVTIISGVSVLYVQLLDANKKNIQTFYLQKDGYVAIDDFFKSNTPTKKFKVFGEDGFLGDGNTLDWTLSSAVGQETQKTIQVKVGLYVAEETGYRQYGQRVNLLEPMTFNVPIWDAKNVTMPFLELAIDKTNIAGDMDTKQNGMLGREGTEIGYQLSEKGKIWYTAFALNSDKYPGLNAKEVADDFIHAGTYYANYNQMNDKRPFKDYDIGKYTLPWDHINNLLDSKNRLSKLSYRVNKAVKNSNLMNMFETVTINGMKGYAFKTNTDEREHINATDWTPKGNFVIYILEHPTNPKLTLIISSSVKNNGNTLEETDALLQTFINSIKK
ncbi:hypothetical protein [Flavobacterium microcysteis]|uniref:Class A beta-lactamase-related serine hydrolase n=1 Tax=Flavobacterium microcysteis TaxID=2596891 RepID=A0A501QDE6_9FLAO|nr:hypothetical protein [Flavobacterium microcysteis]TPD69986.1 hypothetical protein FJA49_08780 [Flavobacterium microcysteis]